MKLLQTLVRLPFTTSSPPASSWHSQNSILTSNSKRVSLFGRKGPRFPNCACTSSGPAVSSPASNPSTQFAASDSGFDPVVPQTESGYHDRVEEGIEKVIYRFRFMAILGVFGSLFGSFLCFMRGCTFVAESFMKYLVDRTKVIQMLIEAVDVYLLGTVMLVFGMGLYELFVSTLDSASSLSDKKPSGRSNLFGLFTLKERPKWLDINSVNELKTKIGHVIVMLLLIGLFDRSKKAAINTPVDLLCFCASILFSSGGLFLLSKL